MATVYYKGLTGIIDSVIVTLTTTTIDQLIAAIAADEGLSTEYYHISLSTDPSKNDITYGDSSTKLSDIGYTDGCTVICTTSQVGSKEERQVAKLEIAKVKRAATGRPSIYNRDDLPTKYVGNGVVDNSNTGGLKDGRPWSLTPPYSAGLYRSQYTGWPNQNTSNPTWFDGKTPAATTVSTNFSLTLTAGETSRAYQWLGYFLPDFTGTWTFTTSGVNIDDCLTIWIGPSALSGYTSGNAVADISITSGSGTISLTSGTYYPIRVQYANNSGPGTNHLRWGRNGSTPSTDFSGLVFYNPATNGF